ncbi:GNAT family N-acetyltransferase [Candidatus Oscillochloris fontis]|uniref:GNAT family N-acetyltransferase n=1 Tax=Candidatus Oscillochloris fontis TaxID=2496868 RepID=UPI00101CCFA3|nr:GNAT family N-acetyltransferase [Candidatus Oscillochloris fontis]
MAITICHESPDTHEAAALVRELDAYLLPLYPLESHHGLDVSALVAERVSFFVLRLDGVAAGCGGVKIYAGEYGELKRMYIRPAYRERGLSRLLLHHIEGFTRAQGVNLLRLETGVLQDAAIGLYRTMGFIEVGPFGAYKLDPQSIFFEKWLG